MVTNTIESLPDNELVKLLSGGSRAAFAELYVRYRGRLMYFCKRFLKDQIASEDLVQDIFIQLWDTREMLNPELSLSGYIHTLAQNRILNVFRQFDTHSRFAKYVLHQQPEESNQTEHQLIDKDYTEILDKAIKTLSPKQKEVFRLSRMQGLSHKEISEQLNISTTTVQEHISIALKKIKEYVAKDADIHFKKLIIFLTLFP